MFTKRKKVSFIKYDSNTMTPVLRCSICNGEQVAGFKNKKTGHFTEIMVIKNSNDLQMFKREYGISQITKEY